MSLLLPQLARAQFSEGFEAGHYILADSHAPQTGLLKLQNDKRLFIKTPGGKTLKLKPDQIQSFRIGIHRYAVVKNF